MHCLQQLDYLNQQLCATATAAEFPQQQQNLRDIATQMQLVRQRLTFPQLLQLPDGPLRSIAHMAGVGSRQACKQIAELYGPVPRLRPTCNGRHLSGGYNELQASLSSLSRLQHVTDLDLSCVLDDAVNAIINKEMPRLRKLRVGHIAPGFCAPFEMLAGRCAGTLQELDLGQPDLQLMLHFPSALAALPRLTALRALTLPNLTDEGGDAGMDLSVTSALTGLTKLAFSHYDIIDVAADAILAPAEQLPGLVELRLPGWVRWGPASFALLRRLRGLTALSVGCTWQDAVAEDAEAGGGGGGIDRLLLAAVGSLTGLRDLALVSPALWTSSHVTALSRLRLESFGALHNGDTPSDDNGDTYEASGALAAVGAHGALTRVRFQGDVVAPHRIYSSAMALDGATLRRSMEKLAASVRCFEAVEVRLSPTMVLQPLLSLSRLQRLEIRNCLWEATGALPQAMFFDDLTRLTGLTSLSIAYAQKQGARAPAVSGAAGQPSCLGGQVGALTRLRELQLLGWFPHFQSRELSMLLPLQQLRGLTLTAPATIWLPACDALQHLAALRRVGFKTFGTDEEWVWSVEDIGRSAEAWQVHSAVVAPVWGAFWNEHVV
jgi:hypothetical protein